MEDQRKGVSLADVGALLLALVVFWQAVNLISSLPSDLFDFRIFRDAGAAVLGGHSPWSVDGFFYPPSAALAFVPVGAAPFWLGATLFTVLGTAALVGALYVLEIRDWRCYAAVLISYPTAISVSTGTVSGLMALLAALVWRYRERRWIAALALAGALALKLFLWPLLVWLFATRRRGAAFASGALTGALIGLGWAVIGLSQIGSYDHAARAANGLAQASYSPYALFGALGLTGSAAKVLVATLGIGLLMLSWAARRDDARAFNLALAAALMMSPVIWVHYFVLLYVPIAIARPRLSPLWFVPAVYVFIGLKAHADGSLLRICLNLGAAALVFGLAYRTSSSDSRVGRPAHVAT